MHPLNAINELTNIITKFKSQYKHELDASGRETVARLAHAQQYASELFHKGHSSVPPVITDTINEFTK